MEAMSYTRRAQFNSAVNAGDWLARKHEDNAKVVVATGGAGLVYKLTKEIEYLFVRRA